MKLTLLTFMSLALMMSSAFAGNVINVRVKGMVCSFCARGIEKKFKSEPVIESIGVGLENKTVTLTTKNGQDISDERIRLILADAGYSIEHIGRE